MRETNRLLSTPTNVERMKNSVSKCKNVSKTTLPKQRHFTAGAKMGWDLNFLYGDYFGMVQSGQLRGLQQFQNADFMTSSFSFSTLLSHKFVRDGVMLRISDVPKVMGRLPNRLKWNSNHSLDKILPTRRNVGLLKNEKKQLTTYIHY